MIVNKKELKKKRNLLILIFTILTKIKLKVQMMKIDNKLLFDKENKI
jgi:hypothetical protein